MKAALGDLLQSLSRSDSEMFFHVSASKLIPGTDTAWVSTATLGLPASEVRKSKILHLVASESRVTDIVRNASPPPPPVFHPPVLDEPSGPPRPPTLPAFDGVGQVGADSGGQIPAFPAAVQGPAANLRPAVGKATAVLAQQHTPDGCYYRNGNWQCATFLQGRNFSAYAFRSWSTKGFGMRSRMKMETGALQQWQNGTRTGGSVGTGNFGVSGTTARTITTSNSSGIVDTWAERGDCWGPANGQAPPGNSYNCPAYPGPHPSTWNGQGFWGTYGTDGWRWEQYRWTVYQPSGFTYSYVEETVRNVTYIGGAEYIGYLGPHGYDFRPADIRANQWGYWSQYPPDTGHELHTEGELTVEGASQFEIRASIGAIAVEGSFSSTSTQKRVDRVTIDHKMLTNLEAPAFGLAIRYDVNFAKTHEFWSCQLHQGWTGGIPCWTWPGTHQTTYP